MRRLAPMLVAMVLCIPACQEKPERPVSHASRGAPDNSPFAVGKVAPNIVGTDADGVKFQLKDYRGKVVVLDFWGEW